MSNVDELTIKAMDAARRYVRARPGSALHPNPLMWAGATNRIVRLTTADGPLVLKYFVEDERRERERWGLNHLRGTGMVPRIVAEPPGALVMTEIPTAPLLGFLSGPHLASRTVDAGVSLGLAAASLLNVPLSTAQQRAFEGNFYDGQRLDGYLSSIINAARAVHATCAYYQAPLFEASLALLEDHSRNVLDQPRLLYHQDAGNIGFVHGRVSGFFDLEMCRVGTISTQLGSLFVMFEATPLQWRDVRVGVEVGLGRPLRPSEVTGGAVFANLLIWRYITRYGKWHGEVSNERESEREALDAIGYARSLEVYAAAVEEG